MEYDFLCGKCCFDLGMSLSERKLMASKLKDGINVCECCGRELFVEKGVFRSDLSN